MFLLTSDRLRVEITMPGESPNFGCRFDRAAFVSDVTLDGDRHFCANEPRNLIHPSSHGRGLCCEFTADYSGEVGEGAYYPKLGIGLIKKEGPYLFHRRYTEVWEYPVTVTHDETAAHFVTEPLECLGVAVCTEKTVTVANNTLTLETTLSNVGTRAVTTGEYCHNFLSIDGMAIAPDYRLDLPMLKGLEHATLPNEYPTPCNFVGTDYGIAFARAEREVSLANLPLDGLAPAERFCWTLHHTGAKAWVLGEDEVRPDQITLWATDHIVSPEIRHSVTVLPGASLRWRRRWTFEQED